MPWQADVLETGNSALAGWNSQVFWSRKRISEHGKHLEQVFGGNFVRVFGLASHRGSGQR